MIRTFASQNAHVLLLCGAALGWYIASHAAADGLGGARLAIARRTLGIWIPIICTALLALAVHQTDMAVGVLLATSVAAMSLVLGIVTVSTTFTSPTSPSSTVDAQPNRRIWAFILPASLLALLAGFTGRLGLLHAIALAAQGFAILALIDFKRRRHTTDPAYPSYPDAPPADLSDNDRARHPAIRAAQIILAVGLAIVASSAGVRAAIDISSGLGLVSPGLVTSLMIAPALVLSMIGIGMHLARAGLYQSAMMSSVGVVLLNLCLGLPLVIGVWAMRPVWDKPISALLAMTDVAPQPIANDDAENDAPVTDFIAAEASLRYPLASWRIDTVILILLGVAILPVAAGRWLPGRLDGMLLVLLYIIYMGLTALLARA